MQVLNDTSQLAAALSPLRMRVLREMHQPESATSLAPRLGLSRQTLNYHLRDSNGRAFSKSSRNGRAAAASNACSK